MTAMPRLPIPSRILSLFRLSQRGLRRQPPPVAEPGSASLVSFRCNLCGVNCRVPATAISRETPSCDHCGSTVRSRAMVHLLTLELFGRSIALPDLQERRDIVGIGLSDAECYARPLARKLGYTNTYFRTKPRLDICNVPDDRAALYDFIIASDVFEHVVPPVSRAFANARRLLKPGGVLIFSVPFSLEADTAEHFPDLNDYRLVNAGGRVRLENRCVDGRMQTFDDLVFHRDPVLMSPMRLVSRATQALAFRADRGDVLEMRRFSRAGIEREVADAGFVRSRVADEDWIVYGIAWQEPFSMPMVAYAPPEVPSPTAVAR
jgi:SAM-dependent methyltransferase